MKILHIIPNLNKGGAERLVTDIVRELKKRKGIEVRVVLFRDEIEYDIEGIQDIVKIIPASVQLSLWKRNKRYINALQHFLDTFQPDIIHSHLFEAEIVSRSCYYPTAKWFSHAHSNMMPLLRFSLNTLFNKVKLTKFYERSYLLKRYKRNRGNAFIAISKNTANFLSNQISQAKIYTLNNAIDFKAFYVNNKSINKSLHLINVGSLNKNKNQEFLIDIVDKIIQKGIVINLNLIGDGPEMENLQKKVKDKNLTGCIFFEGAVSNVPYHLAKSSLYVHTAKSEAFGLVLLEAMAAGLPVITLDGIGNRDILEEGKNGFMLFEQNTEQFAQKIINLWNDKTKMKEMSAYAQNYAKQYDISPYIDKLLVIYKS